MASLLDLLSSRAGLLSYDARSLTNRTYLDKVNRQPSFTQNWVKYMWSASAVEKDFLICGVPGGGKTIPALFTVIETLREYYAMGVPLNEVFVLFITYAPEVLLRDLLQTPALRQVIVPGVGNIASIMSHVEIMGYKSFESRLFLSDESAIEILSSKTYPFLSPQLTEHIQSGGVRLNLVFLEWLKKVRLIVCDEAHKLYSAKTLNLTGQAVAFVQHLFPEVRCVFVTATPFMTQISEAPCLLNLLLRSTMPFEAFLDAKQQFSLDILKSKIQELYGRIFIVLGLMDNTIPPHFYHGQALPGAATNKQLQINNVWCPHTSAQEEACAPYTNWARHVTRITILEQCALFTADKMLLGVDIPPSQAVQYLDELRPAPEEFMKASGKLTVLYDLLFTKALLKQPGNILLYHQYVIYPGIALTRAFLLSLGFFERLPESLATTPSSKSILCLGCLKITATHADHEFVPAIFVIFHGQYQDTTKAQILQHFNHKKNAFGAWAKIILGSSTISESVSLYHLRTIIIMERQESLGAHVQLVGRFQRPNLLNEFEAKDRSIHTFMLAPIAKATQTYHLYQMQIQHARWEDIRAIMLLLFAQCPMMRVLPNMYQDINEPPADDAIMRLCAPYSKGTRISARPQYEYIVPIAHYFRLSEKNRPNSFALTERPPITPLNHDMALAAAMRYIKLYMYLHKEAFLEDIIQAAASSDSVLGLNPQNLPAELYLHAACVLHYLGSRFSGLTCPPNAQDQEIPMLLYYLITQTNMPIIEMADCTICTIRLSPERRLSLVAHTDEGVWPYEREFVSDRRAHIEVPLRPLAAAIAQHLDAITTYLEANAAKTPALLMIGLIEEFTIGLLNEIFQHCLLEGSENAAVVRLFRHCLDLQWLRNDLPVERWNIDVRNQYYNGINYLHVVMYLDKAQGLIIAQNTVPDLAPLESHEFLVLLKQTAQGQRYVYLPNDGLDRSPFSEDERRRPRGFHLIPSNLGKIAAHLIQSNKGLKAECLAWFRDGAQTKLEQINAFLVKIYEAQFNSKARLLILDL